MELTKQDIQVVKSYVNKYLNYVDLKIEVLDHMIMDTEKYMQKLHISFEEAFTKTTLKWNRILQKDVNFIYFGSLFYAPRIVINKAKKIYKFYFFGYLAVYFLPLLLFKKFTPVFNDNFITYFDTTVYLLLYVALVVFNFIWLKIFFGKYKTTYSFIIKTFLFMNVFLIIPLIDKTFFTNEGKLTFIFVSFASTFLYITTISLLFYSKHLKSLKKYKMV